MDEIKLTKSATRGNQARSIIESEIFREVHQQIEHDLIAAWLNTGYKETEDRERIWTQIQASRRHPHLFAKVAADGKLAQRELNEIVNKKRFKIV